jgi:hypothetical protein
MHLLLLDPVADQTENEVDQRIHGVVMLFAPKSK